MKTVGNTYDGAKIRERYDTRIAPRVVLGFSTIGVLDRGPRVWGSLRSFLPFLDRVEPKEGPSPVPGGSLLMQLVV